MRTLPYVEKEIKAKSMRYEIIGDPIPLARARFGNGRAYDGQLNSKNICKIGLVSQHGDSGFFYGPLHLDIIFFMKIPPSVRKSEHDPHFVKPDLSNLIKFVEDLGTGIIYPDDNLITLVSAKKCYSKIPRTIFTITKLSKRGCFL